MKHSFLLIICSLLLFSCGNNAPRKPIVRKTSSFMEESVSFNKSLITEEEKLFQQLIKNDSLSTYKTSSNGFWYKFEQKSV